MNNDHFYKLVLCCYENQAIFDLFKLFLAFVLTTVFGGLLGYYFQKRSWTHQNTTKLLESERNVATKLFEEISVLLDKRLYSMRQLYWKINDSSQTQSNIDIVMDKYREILYEWNDNLNRNLALVQAYFGEDIRNILQYNVFESFIKTGGELERKFLERKNNTQNSANSESLNEAITGLGISVYNINLKMINLIQQNKIGVFMTNKFS